jgi:hypothetical protein
VTRRSFGIALLAGGTLLAEVALTRVLSISLFHHIAFLVVSTALLGMGAAGITVAVSKRLAAADADRIAAFGCLGFGALVPVCHAAAQLIGVEPLEIAERPAQAAALALVYVAYALPFYATGLAVAALLDRYAEDAPGLYGADLIGAGIGSFLALAALAAFGSAGALVTGAALGASGAAFFGAGRLRIAGVAAAILLAALATVAGSVLPLHITKAKTTRSGTPFAVIAGDPKRSRALTEETALARVDLVEFSTSEKRLLLDAGVAAIRIPPEGFSPQRSDATLPYELRPGAPALVIGSGAGWEVAEALAFGASRVDAVEINAAVERHTPRAIRDDRRARMVVDEGRSFLERQATRYGSIVMIHTISNAATSAGALQLAEDYLLTVEAMEAALAHLDDRGLLLVTRPESQLPRLLATIVRALGDRRASERVVAWVENAPVSSFYAAVLVSPSPIPPEDIDRIEARLAERRLLSIVARPGARPADPMIERILAGGAVTGEIERLDPATDDRPFFNQRRRFSDLGFADLSRALSSQAGARLALEDQPIAELSALALLVETTVVGAILLVLPLLLSPRSEGRAGKRRVAATLAYFGLLGFGFMLIEIALIQRLSLLLGKPAVAFATVFSGLLIGAGLGSRIAERSPLRRFAPAVAAVVAASLAAGLAPAVAQALPVVEIGRIGIALAVVLPAGVALGMPFPLGLLESAKGAGGRLVPWAFAANGIASIAGTVSALILATEIGFRGVLGLAAALYVIAQILFPRLGRE